MITIRATFLIDPLKEFSLAMIVLGTLALFFPLAAGISITILVGLVLLSGGFAYSALAFAVQGTGTFIWRLLAGLAFAVSGLDLIFHPAIGLFSLTLIVAAAFFFEAVTELGSYLALRVVPGSGWLLFNAALTLLLSILIWRNWPVASAWALGALVGINMISTGLTPIMYTAAQKRLVHSWKLEPRHNREGATLS